jgi:hypothetical protein
MRQGRLRFSHRVFGCDFDSVRCVDDAVQDRIGEAAAAKELMPVRKTDSDAALAELMASDANRHAFRIA